jgi:Cu(I)/Ag(I) efflux system membrane fusion protein
MSTIRTFRVFAACGLFFFAACTDHAHEKHAQPLQKDSTGKIPAKQEMIGMDNMPGMQHSTSDHSEMIALTAQEQLVAGIATQPVVPTDFQQSVTALGIVVVDESTVSVITAKVRGRIDKLYVRNPGEEIRAEQALYNLYSETLFTEEQDLILLTQQHASSDLIAAAEQKLKLHGLTAQQIAVIEKQQSASGTVTVYSNTAGYLAELPAREGQYVEAGDVLFQLSSLDEVRANAQVYPQEIAAFQAASEFEVTSESHQGTIYEATKLYDNPALDANSKILNVRLRVQNPDHLLRPGMMTTVSAVSKTEKLLTIPKTAVLTENGMSFTWVQEPDGMFSRRMISTGRENENVMEILSGLQKGDRVVTSGIYLLNSEYILRKGAGSMGGMKM